MMNIMKKGIIVLLVMLVLAAMGGEYYVSTYQYDEIVLDATGYPYLIPGYDYPYEIADLDEVPVKFVTKDWRGHIISYHYERVKNNYKYYHYQGER